MRRSTLLPSPLLLLLLLLPALGSSCANGDPDDFDQDGVVDGEDCDPEDATIYPGANAPIGDQIDQNCGGVDGIADPGVPGDVTDECGWPVWSGAASLGSPGFVGSPAVGDQLPRLAGVDQCGEEVHLYHLGGGPPLIISVHAMWSPPDRDMASWLAGTGGTPAGWTDDYDDVREAVEEGELRWVSLLLQNDSGGAATAADAVAWASDYPTDNVPVLTGEDVTSLFGWFGSKSVPYLVLVDGNMQLLTFGSNPEVLDAAQNDLNSQ